MALPKGSDAWGQWKGDDYWYARGALQREWERHADLNRKVKRGKKLTPKGYLYPGDPGYDDYDANGYPVRKPYPVNEYTGFDGVLRREWSDGYVEVVQVDQPAATWASSTTATNYTLTVPAASYQGGGGAGGSAQVKRQTDPMAWLREQNEAVQRKSRQAA